MTKWQECGIPLDVRGPLTKLDHDMMTKRELATRKLNLDKQIAEAEEEIRVIDERKRRAPLV